MDLSHFLRERTALIRLFYEKGRLPFDQMQKDIEDEVPPWEPPPFNPETDDPEPPFVAEYMQAEHARELIGLFAVSLLSDTLKLYFEELMDDLGIEFKTDKDRKETFKSGWVEGYRQILETVMGEAYASCPVQFDLIEQVVLARNDFAHNTDLIIFRTQHNLKTLKKHPNPLFVGPRYEPPDSFEDDATWKPRSWRRSAKIEVSPESMMVAIAEVELLAAWVQEHQEVMWSWNSRPRQEPAD